MIPSGLPRNLEAAIQRYGSATYKAPAATVLDPNGKLSINLTYGNISSLNKTWKLSLFLRFLIDDYFLAFRDLALSFKHSRITFFQAKRAKMNERLWNSLTF